MKIRISIFVALSMLLVLPAGSVYAQAKKVADYKITAIKIISFDEQTGKFGGEVDAEQWFGNALDISLFASIELTGPAGEFVPNRNVSVTVTEGKKIKLRKTAFPGVLSENGKYYIPVWLYGSMCDPVKLTAAVTGQQTRSTLSRTINFHCGE
jgi:hypothetical protein